MAIAVTSEQLAMAGSIGQWAKRAGTIASVRGLETKGGRTSGEPWAQASWAAMAELGIFSVALPPALGGAGGSTADVAVVAEQLAVHLAPGPVLPTLLAALVLAGQPDAPAAALLAGIAAGTVSVAAPLTAGGLTAVRFLAGGLVVEGTASLVLGAGDTSHLMLPAETEAGQIWFMVEAGDDQPGLRVAPRAPVDFSRALGDVRLTGLQVRPDQLLPGIRPELAASLGAMLAAAEAAGIAGWCVATAAGYARTRQQFGRPIGSFQAIKHICAGMLGRSELAAAMAWDAACAADEAPDELPLASAAAAAVALDAAVDNAKDAIQVLGGIGFTWEHDAHLYLRRALALRQLLGGSAAWRVRAAELATEGMRRHSIGDVSARSQIEQLSDSKAPPAADQARRAAALVASAVSAVPPERRAGALAEVGYVAPAWPRPYGLAATPAEQLVIDEELARAGITRPDLAIGNWAIPAIASHGTADQLARFAEPTLRGHIVWCQLFSEPEAGSDLASLRTRAVRVQGEAVPGASGPGASGPGASGWRLTGQKVWTSLAGEADWAICLARTDQDVPKHKGITYFLVRMRSPGIDIRPLREITGQQMFNEVFLDDVFVPDDCVVGKPGDGWRIARTTLTSERAAMVRGGGHSEEVEKLLAAAAGAGVRGDPTVLDQVGARLAEGMALSAMDERLARQALDGRLADGPSGPGGSGGPSGPGGSGGPSGPGVAGGVGGSGGASDAGGAGGAGAGSGAAVRKLLGVAHRQAVAETALVLCGERGAASDGHAADAVHEFLLSRCLSIAGGTSQILLTLVAERVLGLPREEAR